MSSCHLTAGCSPETQYGSVTQTEAQAGNNSPYSNWCHHKPTAARSGQPGHRAEPVTVTWEAAQPCLCKDERWLTRQHGQQFFLWSVFQITGIKEAKEYTNLQDQLLQAKPVLPSCSFLVTQVAGLCFAEVTGASTKDHFAKRVSVLDALQPGWFCPWVNSSGQQLRVCAEEISSRWNTDRADLSYSLCCHPERCKCKQVLLVWHSIQKCIWRAPRKQL